MDHKNWIPYKELDLHNEENNVFSIDTRDFHGISRFEEKSHPDLKVLQDYKHFFFTSEEVWELLDSYYEESGGEGEWRMFALEDDRNWSMKYIRIWRTPVGFLICNSNNKALKKEDLNKSINKKYLYFIKNM